MAAECVLIVDDDPMVRKVLTKVVVSNGFVPAAAASGEEALALLQRQHVDLIILDIMMGGMDGFEVVQEIRRRRNETPIIILSARTEDYNTLYGLDIGADDYITKPFNPVLMGAKVKALIRRHKTARSGTQAIQTVGPFVYHNDTMRLEKDGWKSPSAARRTL